MKTRPQLIVVGLVLCAASVCARAENPSAQAGERCESAVADTVKRIRGKDAQEIQFVGDKRVLLPAKGDEIDVKGEGRYSGRAGDIAATFAYSCVFNSRSGATSGVLFRETGVRTGAQAGAADAPVGLDLAQFSPQDCESAAASALKSKYPRVGRIVFDGEGRELRAAADGHTTLDGQGAVERAAGMNQVPFKYRCDIESRSGKVVKAQTTE
jgi:hypothetical protein